MKLLFDENLPTKLVHLLEDAYPGSAHVQGLGLSGAADRTVWDRAADGGFILVTKDEDFHRLSVMLGPPPKVIWVRLGNSTTPAVEVLLRRERDRIEQFSESRDEAFLTLG